MPTELLAYGRGTRGSHSVLMHGRRLRTKAFAPLRSFSVENRPSFRAVRQEYAPPVQSAGESQLSLRIENYLSSVLGGLASLASASPMQIRMTASPAARAASMDPWKFKNRRRIRLIEKQHKGSLNAKETAELATLESQFSAHLKEVAPRSREVLDEFSDYIARMKAKVAAKKGIKS
jgi:hypothetical protein